MSLRITKRQLALGGLSLLAVLSAALVTEVAQAAGVVAGTTRTVTRDLEVQGTAEASISFVPSGTLLAGEYLGIARQLVGTYEAKVTGGTLAIRFNPTVGRIYGTGSPASRVLVNTSDSTKTLAVIMAEGNTEVINGWKVFREGIQEYKGTVTTLATQTVSSGVYPIAIDAVAWLY